MARRAAWVLIVALGCAHAARSPAPAIGDSVAPVVFTPPCTAYEFYGLSLTSFPSETGAHDAFDTADAAARAHYDRGAAAGATRDYAEAAKEFLACGGAYRAVPDADPGIATAIKNAQRCYKNAILSFANAGTLHAQGVLLDLTASDDHRLADYIRAELAKAPIECPARPSR